MKYKNINSGIHNFGHSFFSHINYVNDSYIIDELLKIHQEGHDIKIDWITLELQPARFATITLNKSIAYWKNNLESSLSTQNVELQKITSLYFIWKANENKKYMFATDDRGKEYKIYIKETL